MASITFLYTTLDNKKLAEQLAENAIKAKMAACVNIIPGAISVYEWKGEIKHTQECLLIFKTTAEQLKKLKAWFIHNHPYELPAIITGKANCSDAFFRYINEAIANK